jgi:hypothetical protein
MLSDSKVDKKVNLWIRQILERIELLFGYFFIFRLRGIKSEKIMADYSSYSDAGDDFAIIMQGPVIKKAGFTFETLKLYRKVYPGIKIILSTWNNTDKAVLEEISKLNIHILTSELPDFPGDSNMNYQLKSTISGLQILDENKVKYVLKTRTDQRIFTASDYLKFMAMTLESFPVKSAYLKKRLIVSNLNMFRHRKYIVSDMFMFGTLSDMKLFWDIPFQEKEMIEDKNKEFYENKLAEAYLIDYFFRNTGFIPEKTLEDSDRFLGKNFYILDKNVIDLYWYKYNHSYERSIMIVDGKKDRPYSTLDWQPL